MTYKLTPLRGRGIDIGPGGIAALSPTIGSTSGPPTIGATDMSRPIRRVYPNGGATRIIGDAGRPAWLIGDAGRPRRGTPVEQAALVGMGQTAQRNLLMRRGPWRNYSVRRRPDIQSLLMGMGMFGNESSQKWALAIGAGLFVAGIFYFYKEKQTAPF